MKKLSNFRLFLLLYCSIALLSAPLALAHPGRLDKDGCHQVHKDWKYKSGKVLKAGTEHCHRGLGKMRLDGKELLEDPNDPGEEQKEKQK